MIKIKSGISLVTITITSFLVFVSSISYAALVQGTMTGFIAEHAETRGVGDSVFGLDGAGLLGQSFVVDFYYRTDLAPVSWSGVGTYDARTVYESSDAGLDWLGLSIMVNDTNYSIDGFNRRADIGDVYTDPNLSNGDRMQLSLEGNAGPFDGISFRREFMDISVSFPNDTLDSHLLPTSLSSNQIERVFNSAAFRINDYDIDPVSGTLMYERYVSFNLDVQSIELATVVPIPASIWLFGSALAGIFMTLRKTNKAKINGV